MKKMVEKFTGKIFFFVSLCVVGYFCLLCLNAYVVKSDFILIGFVQELLTLPLILFQLVLFILSILHCMKDQFRIKRYSFWSFFVLLVSNLFVFISFM